MTQDRSYLRSTYIVRKEVCVSGRFESLAEKIPQMPETNEDHVADVGRKQNVIRRVLFLVVDHGLARRVLRREAVFLVCAVAEFRMDGSEHLFRGWGNGWVGKSVVVVEHFGLAFT